MTQPTLGFIGLGRMGAPMAGRLLDAGHATIVCDTDETAVRSLADRGATAARSAREVADGADIVFASLPTPEVVESVALGAQGIVHGSRVRLFIDLSTTGPRVSAKIATGLANASRPIDMLDSPVSGGGAGAATGKLTLMIAGSRQTYNELEPVLKVLGKLFYCGGKPGQGQTLKLANNLMSAAALAVGCEALVMGMRAGLDPNVMMEVINVSSGRSGASQDKIPKYIISRSFDFGFSIGLSHKDTRLCVEEAEALGVPMIMGSAVRQVLAMARQDFGADADFTNIVRLFEQWAGVEVRAPGAGA
ncbi:NAD(P)-dependent oxidoreductase [soil metagenome]